MINNKKLFNKLEKFLEKKCKSDRGGWAKLTHEDTQEMFDIFHMIAEAKCELDADGDLPVQIKVINRRYFKADCYSPIGYEEYIFERKDETPVYKDDENFDLMLSNLEQSTREIETWIRLNRIKMSKKDV